MGVAEFSQQLWSVLGVYAVTVIILIIGVIYLWRAFRSERKESTEMWRTLVVNNTVALENNTRALERFDDFVRYGGASKLPEKR